MGKIVKDEISRLPIARPYIQIYEYIIMPDHIHILLVRSEYEYHKDDGSIYDGPILWNIIWSLKANITKKIQSDSRFESFAWQSRYHDRIIRTSQEYDNIKYYIQQNPINWENN